MAGRQAGTFSLMPGITGNHLVIRSQNQIFAFKLISKASVRWMFQKDARIDVKKVSRRSLPYPRSCDSLVLHQKALTLGVLHHCVVSGKESVLIPGALWRCNLSISGREYACIFPIKLMSVGSSRANSTVCPNTHG